jgi:ATP-binding cassette subfamily C (CFTR/MRP) protein 1
LFSKLGEYLQTKQLKAKDKRIKLMNEILAGMKVLKLYAWEIPFMKRLGDIRGKEIRLGYIRFWHS